MSFSFGYLLDEHLPWRLFNHIRGHFSALPLYKIGDDVAPDLGTLDPEILIWCEANYCVLVTNNRKSMPRHLRDHIAAGNHCPGIFTLRKWARIGAVAEQLALIAGASFENEYMDQIIDLSINE